MLASSQNLARRTATPTTSVARRPTTSFLEKVYLSLGELQFDRLGLSVELPDIRALVQSGTKGDLRRALWRHSSAEAEVSDC